MSDFNSIEKHEEGELILSKTDEAYNHEKKRMRTTVICEIYKEKANEILANKERKLN